MKRLNRVGLAVSAVCAGALSSPAGAQGALEEIVVTARKTEETLQEAPVAVTAFTAERLEERGIESVADVARFTPGLVFDQNFGRATERPVIRGQGNVLAGVTTGAEAGAAYFIDGIYFSGDVQSLDLSDVQRVEVIRGPQSALYGRNTYSGAINFVTRAPLDTFAASARASYDSDEVDASLRLEGPIVDGLAGSISFRYYDFEGQHRNQVTGKLVGEERTEAVNAVLDWQPNDDFRLRVRGGYTDDDDGTRPLFLQDSSFNNCYPGTRSLTSYGNATNGVPANDFQYFCGAIRARPVALNDGPTVNPVYTPAVPASLVFVAPPAQIGGTVYRPEDGVEFSGVARERRYASALADWDVFGSGYTLSVASALRNESRFTGADSTHSPVNYWFPAASFAAGSNAFLNSSDRTKFEDWSLEMRFASPVDRSVRWMVGAFHYELDQKQYTVNFVNPNGQSIPVEIGDTLNTAVFGLVEWQFAEKWSITAEGRYAEETKKLVQRAAGTVNPGAVNYRDEGQFDKFTPRVTLDWKATDDLSLYAIYAEGNKPGGLNGSNGLANGFPTWDEETSTNYELGLKAAWLDGRLVTNVATYFIDAKDVQLTTAVPPAPGTTASSISVVTNQGAAEIFGVEFEATWRPIDPLTLSLTYALADSEFTEGCDDFQWVLTSGGGLFNPANPTANNLNGQGNCSIEGNQLPLSAKNQGSLAIDWRQPFANGLEWYVNADVSYTDKRYVQVHNLAYVPEATLVGARLGISGERWSAGLYGRNLTDEDAPLVATRWFTLPYGFGYGAQVPVAQRIPGADYGAPRGFFGTLRRERQVGVEFTYRYGN
ncbi:MAG: TonB-dependent receptor [Steroidobacteraceae bacterium]|jgi:outer membrane receptor protein involved in Fe transport|nr:TonB-dependent receptor [Steroidobacteraceae bacterium]